MEELIQKLSLHRLFQLDNHTHRMNPKYESNIKKQDISALIKSHEGKCNQEMACLEDSQIHTSAAILILHCERNLGRVVVRWGSAGVPPRMIVADRRRL